MNFSAFRRITAFFVSIITMICGWLNLPITPMGEKLDLTGYELVFCEEFDGDSLNRDVWNFTPPFNGCISSENSFEGYNLYGAVNSEKMLEFSNSNLIMHIKYCEDGIDGNGPGYYYAPEICSAKSFNPVYGYFECRAILPKSSHSNAAFWINSENMYLDETGYKDGVEIDVFESMRWNCGTLMENTVEHNIHYYQNGEWEKSGATAVRVKGNPYEEYHTYGVLWEPTGYIFYIDGVESMRTSYAVSQSPEHLILSYVLRQGERDDMPSEKVHVDNGDAKFIIDYVKAYQKP